MEDEEHFLFICPNNNTLRLEFLEKIKNIYTNFDSIDNWEKIAICLSCPEIMRHTVHFIKKVLVTEESELKHCILIPNVLLLCNCICVFVLFICIYAFNPFGV